MNCSVGDWGTVNDIMEHTKTIPNLIASLTYLNCSLVDLMIFKGKPRS